MEAGCSAGDAGATSGPVIVVVTVHPFSARDSVACSGRSRNLNGSPRNAINARRTRLRMLVRGSSSLKPTPKFVTRELPSARRAAGPGPQAGT